MGYSVWLTSIDDTEININALKNHCQNSSNLKFDTSKTWTDLYDQIILVQDNSQWNFVCGINDNSAFSECADPDSLEFFEVVKIADLLNLFVVGEEDEIYYLPNYGKPHNRLDFEKAKLAYKKHGLDIKQIIENSGI